LAAVLDLLREILATSAEGRILRTGLRVAIVGLPNAGKSSLLNRLLGEDRAIVAAVAGTTRDTLEETASVRGWPVVLVDTAGVRDGTDEVEAEGVRRARVAAGRAELLLHVVDSSRGWSAADAALRQENPEVRTLVVWNKADLAVAGGQEGTAVSCATGEGIEALRDRIAAVATEGRESSDGDEIAIGVRHRDALVRAESSLERASAALESGVALDLVALELRMAANAVGEVVGKTATEDLLDAIFSTFCLGK
jgi:tRNA modification GTPase